MVACSGILDWAAHPGYLGPSRCFNTPLQSFTKFLWEIYEGLLIAVYVQSLDVLVMLQRVMLHKMVTEVQFSWRP
jgi:hypothetical protein